MRGSSWKRHCRHLVTRFLPFEEGQVGTQVRWNSTQGGASSGTVSAHQGSKTVFKDPFASFPQTYQPTAEEAARISRRNALTFGALLGTSGLLYYSVINYDDFMSSNGVDTRAVAPVHDEELVNWSGTHSCMVKRMYQPESSEQVEAIVSDAHEKKEKIRCVGSALSPNGISFQEEGMMSVSLMDKVLSVDAEQMTVTVQSGARVQDVADKIKGYGLTLLNYASIREQTIGGFTQIGAHGTGAGIPSVDDSVVRLKIVTPAKGTIYLSEEENPDLFKLAKVGLGCLGVVTEVTLKCVPAHKLVERTFVTSMGDVKRNHTNWLKNNKHLRYMWIPNTDSVVVVQCNPEGSTQAKDALASQQAISAEKSNGVALNSLQQLLKGSAILEHSELVETMSPTECRDALLAHDPLNPSWVASVNEAEAEFWKSNQGIRTGWSDEILGFDCGGQQWVFEVAFPCGTQSSPNHYDIQYMEELLKLIKKHNIAAPSPIEQRWTSGSSSSMSPCSGNKDSLFSWVGIIMYLPEGEGTDEARKAVTQSFIGYKRLVEKNLLSRYHAVEHWAKLEVPETASELADLKKRLHKRYPIEAFQKARKDLDPHNIFGNSIVDTVFGQS